MQLFVAIILFLVGMIAGVLVTLLDVYTVGSAVFLSRLSLWILANVFLGANVRRRRGVLWDSVALNLGFVESYYLMSSFTFEGLRRSALVPLALVSLVAAGIAIASWTAKSERGPLGRALSVLIVVASLVACVIANGGLSLLDLVCAALMLVVLLVMRPMRLDLVTRRRERVSAPVDATAGTEGPRESPGAPARGRAPARQSGRQVRPGLRSGTAQAGDDEARGSGLAGSRRGGGSRASRDGRPGAGPEGEGGARTRPARRAREGRPATDQSGRTQSGRTTRASRPTRRTGGAVPSARRMRPHRSGQRGTRDARDDTRR